MARAWGTPEKTQTSERVHRAPLHDISDRHAACAAPVASAASTVSTNINSPSTESPKATSTDVVHAACSLLDRVVGECPLAHIAADLQPEQVFAPIFHSVSVPGISGGDYLVNHLLRLGLARKEHLSEAVLLHSFLLVDRLLQKEADKGARLAFMPFAIIILHALATPRGCPFPYMLSCLSAAPHRLCPGFHLCTRNVHRVLLAATLVSAKLLDDECYNNKYWASVGGVSLAHLNQLEVEITSLLNFELLVTAPMIDAARARLISTAT